VPGDASLEPRDAEAEKLWTALINEAVPVADTPGVFMFRGATYKVPSRLDVDGRVQVLQDDGQTLWSGVLSGALQDADKRLRAKLKQLHFMEKEAQSNGRRASSPGRPSLSNGHAAGDDGVAVTKSGGARAVRSAPAPPLQSVSPAAASPDDLEAQWEQLMKREGFDVSFQNAILERVQTPIRTPRPASTSQMPAMPSPSHTWPREVSPMSPRMGGGGVSANVEEVPAHLRGRAVDLISASDIYCDPHVVSSASSVADALNYNSASSWTELGLAERRFPERRGESAYSTLSDAQSARFVMVSDFTSSQGVHLKAGVGVSLVRHGQRGWILIRDIEGLKSWVPQAYLQPDKDFKEDEIVHGDGRYELMNAATGVHQPADLFRVPTQAMPVRSTPPTASTQAMCPVSEASNESNDKLSVLESMEHEMFEPWMTDGVEVPRRSKATESPSTQLPRTPSHGCRPEQSTFSLDVKAMEAIVEGLEESVLLLVKAIGQRNLTERMFREDEQQQRERLGQRVSQLHSLADIDMLVKLEHEIFREREEWEKERHTWCVERNQLQLAVAAQLNQSKSSGDEGESTWQSERRQILQDLQSERERSAWLEDRLLASGGAAVPAAPTQDLLRVENQRLQEALERMKTDIAANKQIHRRQLQEQQEALNRLQAAFENRDRKSKVEDDKEKAALRQSIRTLQTKLADRDVALATISHKQLSQLAVDQKDMDGLKKDLLDLGQALSQKPQGGGTLTIDQAKATIEGLREREVMMREQKLALESTVSKLQQRTADLETKLLLSKVHEPRKEGAALGVLDVLTGDIGQKGGKTLAELEVENSALKELYSQQVSKLEQAEKAVEQQRELTVANAVLANKYSTLLRQTSILKQKLDGLQSGPQTSPLTN